MTRQLPWMTIAFCLAEGLVSAAPFRNAEILNSRQTARDAHGQSTRIRLLRTDFKYPLIRQEEQLKLDPTTGQDRITGTVSMVADHIIVTLQPGKTEADLKAALARRGGSIVRPIGTAGPSSCGLTDGRSMRFQKP